MALTLGIGLLLMASLVFLLASNTAAELITVRLPVLGALGQLSHVVRLLVALTLLLLCARSEFESQAMETNFAGRVLCAGLLGGSLRVLASLSLKICVA